MHYMWTDLSAQKKKVGLLRKEAERARAETLLALSGELSSSNCYLELQAGAGGTESQDWTSMLLRMYRRWAEMKGFSRKYCTWGFRNHLEWSVTIHTRRVLSPGRLVHYVSGTLYSNGSVCLACNLVLFIGGLKVTLTSLMI